MMMKCEKCKNGQNNFLGQLERAGKMGKYILEGGGRESRRQQTFIVLISSHGAKMATILSKCLKVSKNKNLNLFYKNVGPNNSLVFGHRLYISIWLVRYMFWP